MPLPISYNVSLKFSLLRFTTPPNLLQISEEIPQNTTRCDISHTSIIDDSTVIISDFMRQHNPISCHYFGLLEVKKVLNICRYSSLNNYLNQNTKNRLRSLWITRCTIITSGFKRQHPSISGDHFGLLEVKKVLHYSSLNNYLTKMGETDNDPYERRCFTT